MSLLKRIEKGQVAGGGTPSPAPAGGGASGGAPAAQPPAGGGLSGGGSLRQRRETILDAVSSQSTDVKDLVRQRLLNELPPGESFDISKAAELRTRIEELFSQILAEEQIVLAKNERIKLLEETVADMLGFGPLEPLLADETITEIMTIGHEKVYIERKGRLEVAPTHFESEEHLRRIIDRIVSPLGRRIDESQPLVDARLPDGSRRSEERR